MKKYLSILFAVVLVVSLMLVPAVASARGPANPPASDLGQYVSAMARAGVPRVAEQLGMDFGEVFVEPAIQFDGPNPYLATATRNDFDYKWYTFTTDNYGNPFYCIWATGLNNEGKWRPIEVWWWQGGKVWHIRGSWGSRNWYTRWRDNPAFPTPPGVKPLYWWCFDWYYPMSNLTPALLQDPYDKPDPSYG